MAAGRSSHGTKSTKGPKVSKGHGPKKAKLGKSQSPAIPRVTVTVTSDSPTTGQVLITFDVPCVVNGTIPLNGDRLDFDQQIVDSPTSVRQFYTNDLTDAFWNIKADSPSIRNYQGGGPWAVSGEF